MKKGTLIFTIFWMCLTGSAYLTLAQGIRNDHQRPLSQVRRIPRQQTPNKASAIKIPEALTEGLIPVKKIGSKFYTYEPLFGAAPVGKENGKTLYPVPQHILKQFSVLKRTKGVMEEVPAASETSETKVGGYAESQAQSSAQSSQPKPIGGYSSQKPETQVQFESDVSGGYGPSVSSAAAPASGGYIYKKPPVAETTTLPPIAEIEEQDVPVEPEIDFEPVQVQPEVDFELPPTHPAIALETDEENLAQAVTPAPKITPVTDTPDFELNKDECYDDGSNPDVWPCGYKGVVRGTEGVDYPIYSSIPQTSFDCSKQQYSGYYADIEARCQSFHVCLRRANFRRVEKWSFLCPNGTVFSQEDFACVWWDMAPVCDQNIRSLYEKNAQLGWDNTEEEARNIKSFMTSMVRSQLQNLPTTQIPTATAAAIRPSPEQHLPITAVRTGFPRPLPTPPKAAPAKSKSKTKTHTEVELQSRSKSKTQSAILKSESEGYEEKSVPNALEDQEVEGFIVNRKVHTPTRPVIERVPDEYLDYDPAPDTTETDQINIQETPAISTVIMMPIAQQGPDGIETVSNVPVVVMMTTPRPPSPKATFQPVGVNNPQGVTIPNLPPHIPPGRGTGGYGYPKTPSKAYGVPPPPSTPTPTYIPPKIVVPVEIEQEQSIDYEYQKPEEQIPVSKPVIDYELPVQEEPTANPPNKEYLQPSETMSAAASNIPPKSNKITGVVTPAAPPSTIGVNNLLSQPAQKSESSAQTAVQTPTASTKQQPPQIKQKPESKPFLSSENDDFDQILGTSGIMDSVEDGESFEGFSRVRTGPRPQPKLNIPPQPQSDNLGTKSQLYNANVRDLYSKKGRSKVQPSDREENRDEEGLTSFEADKTSIVPKIIKPLDEIESTVSDAADNAEIDIPVSEKEVRAFLTQQEDIDPDQILEVHNFDKFALFVPENGTQQKSASTKTSQVQISKLYGTPMKDYQSSSSSASGSQRPPKKDSAAQPAPAPKTKLQQPNGGYAKSAPKGTGSGSGLQQQQRQKQKSQPKPKPTPKPQEDIPEFIAESGNIGSSNSNPIQDNQDQEQHLDLAPLPESFSQIYSPIQSETFVPEVQPLSEPSVQLQAVVGRFNHQNIYSNSASNQQEETDQPSNLPEIVQQILQFQPQNKQNSQSPTQQFSPPQVQQQQFAAPQVQQQQFAAPQVQQQQQLQQFMQQLFQQQQQPFVIQQPQQNSVQSSQQQQWFSLQNLLPADPKPEVFKAQEVNLKLSPPILERQPLFMIPPQIPQFQQQQYSSHLQAQQTQPLSFVPQTQHPLPPIGQTGFFELNQDQFPDIDTHIQNALLRAEQHQDQLMYDSTNQQNRLSPPYRFDYLPTIGKPEIIPALPIHESVSISHRRNPGHTPTYGISQGYNADKNQPTLASSESIASGIYVRSPSSQQSKQPSFIRTHYTKNNAAAGNRPDLLLGAESAQITFLSNRPIQMEMFTHEEGVRAARKSSPISNTNQIQILGKRPIIPVHNTQTQQDQIIRALY